MTMQSVYVLDCSPGVVVATSEPITILQVASADEVYLPLSLDMSESRRLLKRLIASLENHGQLERSKVLRWIDGEDEEDGPASADRSEVGGRFAVPLEEGSLPTPPPPVPVAPDAARRGTKSPARKKPPSRPPLVRSKRPFGRALHDRQVKVLFKGDDDYRRFGLLGAFRDVNSILLVCRRRIPKPGGGGLLRDDFLMMIRQPVPSGNPVTYRGRQLAHLPVSATTWRRMDATPDGRRVLVNGLVFTRMDIWAAWDICSRRIFNAGCRFEEWR